MLKLRRGVVVDTEPLTVRVDGSERRAWADEAMVGEMREGDEVVVNTAALDLELGSGAFDIVHVNLTRGLDGGGGRDVHVMKLNYTSLQHAVEPLELGHDRAAARPRRGPPVLVLLLHGQLAPAAWAAGRRAPGLRLGYVQTGGGALPGSLSRDVADLRRRGLLVGHVTAAPAYGGEHEAISVAGALHAAADRLGWDAIVAGPGPGILGSESRYGHGGMAALDSAHAALALELPTLVAPRMSSGDPRPRHRGLSHHADAVLRLLLAPVRVAAPAGPDEAIEELHEVCRERGHRVETVAADLGAYAASGLPTTTMERSIDDDPLFFAAALAGGRLLAAVSR